MTKAAMAGQVKTRLFSRYTPQQAAQLHLVMLQTVLQRLDNHLTEATNIYKLIAVDRVAHSDRQDQGLPPYAQSWHQVEQGTGDLGKRMAKVTSTCPHGPIVFFGADSPDVPAPALASIPTMLQSHAAAVGPTCDGGYWCLAMQSLCPDLLDGIDWGTPKVYHQTTQAARRNSISLFALPTWHDVDRPEDVDALRDRLTNATEEPLIGLRNQIDRIATSK